VTPRTLLWLPAVLLPAAIVTAIAAESVVVHSRPEAVTLTRPNPAVVVTTPQPVVVKRAAPVKKVTKPRPKARPKAASRPRHKVTAAPRKAVVRHVTRPLTATALMTAAVARIPGYQPGAATWVVTSKYGSWGTADWKNRIIYISPSVPARRMYDVVAHEWSHVLSVMPYETTTDAKAAMNRVFGGSGLTGAERAADCMALRLGATWTNYTDCGNSAWRAAAAKLVAGQRI
jgi:hypothetical protein